MMDFLFVLKNFAMTLVLVYLLQFKIGGQSLESRFDHWLRRSELSHQSRMAAAGAALFIEESSSQLKNKAQNLWNAQVTEKAEKATK